MSNYLIVGVEQSLLRVGVFLKHRVLLGHIDAECAIGQIDRLQTARFHQLELFHVDQVQRGVGHIVHTQTVGVDTHGAQFSAQLNLF